MKLAISLPDHLGAKADRLAHRWGTSRSAVFAKLVREYDEGHDDRLTEAMNAAIDAAGDDGLCPFVRQVGRQVFAKIDG